MPDSVWGTEGSSERDESDEDGKQDSPPPTFGAGPIPSDPLVGRPQRRKRDPRTPEPVPDWLRSDPYSDKVTPGRDPIAVLAVAVGFAGIVVFGILLGFVAAILAGTAGQRARESGRTYELPYLAFGLAFVDIVIWFALRTTLTELPIWIG